MATMFKSVRGFEHVYSKNALRCIDCGLQLPMSTARQHLAKCDSQGAIAAWRAGCETARQELIGMLSSDNVLDRETFDALAERLWVPFPGRYVVQFAEAE